MTPLPVEAAETLALRALAWIAAQDDLLPVFLSATGAGEADLRARAGDPDFLAAVLDFLVMDDAWVIGFCEAQGIGHDMPMRARAALPGGETVHWT
jgi:hypothetical protein